MTFPIRQALHQHELHPWKDHLPTLDPVAFLQVAPAGARSSPLLTLKSLHPPALKQQEVQQHRQESQIPNNLLLFVFLIYFNRRVSSKVRNRLKDLFGVLFHVSISIFTLRIKGQNTWRARWSNTTDSPFKSTIYNHCLSKRKLQEN